MADHDERFETGAAIGTAGLLFVERIGAREQGQEIDDVVLGLILDRQVLTVAPTSASLRSVKVGLVDLRSGEARTVDTGLDPGDDVRLVAGPGAVYVVVRSANGDVGVAALR